jgi:hypothetical protein
MSRKMVWLQCCIAVVGAALLAGCVGVPAAPAPSTAQLLTQAGFQVRQADNAQKLAHLQTLPANQFTTVKRGGQTYHVYADPAANRAFVGNEAAYQRYRVQAAEQRAEESERAAVRTKESNFDWIMYGISQGAGP